MKNSERAGLILTISMRSGIRYVIMCQTVFFNSYGIREEEPLGICAYTKKEADELVKFADFFEFAFKANMPDDYYPNHPNWQKLLDWAQKVLDMLEENNEKYGFKQELYDWEDYRDANRLDEWQYTPVETKD